MGAKLAIATKDRTSAERSRRYRERRKLQSPAAPVTSSVTPTITASRRDGIVPLVLLCAALAVAAVSGSFSVIGLTAVFTGAFWPIIGMGVALESAKLSAVAWLGQRHAASRWIKGTVTALVLALMGLNVIGCYGFLAKAHIDHTIAGEAVIADHQAQIDARERLASAAVADVDQRIDQIDAAVNVATRRGRIVSAMALAAQEQDRRNELVAERSRAASALAAIEVESSGIENERAEVASDSGPVRYLATLAGIEQDTATRWFVLVVALLLDPLALALLLAANATD